MGGTVDPGSAVELKIIIYCACKATLHNKKDYKQMYILFIFSSAWVCYFSVVIFKDCCDYSLTTYSHDYLFDGFK